MFVASGEKLLDTLRQAHARGDSAGVGRVAHTLKGSAANLGAFHLADACRRLEDALSSGADVGEAVARIEIEFERIPAYLEAGPSPRTRRSVPERAGS